MNMREEKVCVESKDNRCAVLEALGKRLDFFYDSR